MTVENNDHIYIPPKATTVGVFGAVYRPASFALGDNTPVRVGDYLKMAGGPLRVADKGQIFVVRANGAVISKRNGALNAHVLPGDVIFVPVKTQSTSPWAKVLQISSVLFQLGLATAAFVALSQ
jgi:protein involved in polysaccharide export with SLBB domain